MVERRFSQSKIELRTSNAGNERVLSGYAARFGTLSADLNGFRERLLPGAFRIPLQEVQDVKMLRDHNPTELLGRVKNGTLTLAEDATGLHFSVTLPDTSAARDVYDLVLKNYLSDCSFAFTLASDGDFWTQEPDPEDPTQQCSVRNIRTIKNCWDCSIVTNPAYPETSVNTNSLAMAASASRSLTALFPEGVPQTFPMEVRSRMASNRTVSQSQLSRQRVINFLLSL